MLFNSGIPKGPVKPVLGASGVFVEAPKAKEKVFKSFFLKRWENLELFFFLNDY